MWKFIGRILHKSKHIFPIPLFSFCKEKQIYDIMSMYMRICPLVLPRNDIKLLA